MLVFNLQSIKPNMGNNGAYNATFVKIRIEIASKTRKTFIISIKSTVERKLHELRHENTHTHKHPFIK